MYIIDRILESNTTLIGYDTQNEINIERIINLLPSVILFDSNSVDEILEYFNSKSYHRDHKLSSLMDENQYVVINLSNITIVDSGTLRSVIIKSFVRQIQSRIYVLNNTDSNVRYKIIFISQTYTSMVPSGSSVTFRNYSTESLYISDLAIRLSGDKLIIEKNRVGREETYNTKEEMREYLIDKIFNNDTKETH